MTIKRPLAVALGTGLIASIGIYVFHFARSPLPWRGTGLFAIEPPSTAKWTGAGSSGLYDPLFLPRQLLMVSNVLSGRAFTSALPTAAGVDAADFHFQKVDQFRSTTLLQVTFAAADQVTAGRVASNACVILARFYSTNQPTLTTSLVDTHTYHSAPLWRRVIDQLFP